jgi:hypothetical protein
MARGKRQEVRGKGTLLRVLGVFSEFSVVLTAGFYLQSAKREAKGRKELIFEHVLGVYDSVIKA